MHAYAAPSGCKAKRQKLESETASNLGDVLGKVKMAVFWSGNTVLLVHLVNLVHHHSMLTGGPQMSTFCDYKNPVASGNGSSSDNRSQSAGNGED